MTDRTELEAAGKAKSSGVSLAEIHGTVEVPSAGPRWRQWFAVSGPALMVTVGYMDPGNWATDLAGGSRYEYKLLWVLLMSNLMAVLLQSLAARLGVVRHRDLAQASREAFPTAVNIPLYVLAELGIAACDLAEVLGSAIALQLLFGWPLLVGVGVTTLDVLLLLTLTRFGVRKLEALVLVLVGTIGLAFAVEILLVRPAWGDVARGFVPGLPDAGALYLAIGILGATVMPHNLYLHSALVQTRRFAGGALSVSRAVRSNTLDSALALSLAFFVNAAILVLAAAAFYRTGNHQIVEIADAHGLLEPILGAAIAPVAFAVALLASGQSSTITGTLAGQIVMEGYLDLRVRPWLRRIVTRLIAIIPAVGTILWAGEHATGNLLVMSQVVLSLQLPFAAIPLIHFVSDRRKMREHAIGRKTQAAAWLVALIIVGLNAGLVVQVVGGWLGAAGPQAAVLPFVIWPAATGLVLLLGWVTLAPWLSRRVVAERPSADIHRKAALVEKRLVPTEPVRRVAIALDFAGREERLLDDALRFLAADRQELVLLHVVESPSARAFGREASDQEARLDAERLEAYAGNLRELGFTTATALGAGDPVRELARLVGEFGAELVILGGHGHRGLMDILHGTTADALRHRVRAAVLVIPLK